MKHFNAINYFFFVFTYKRPETEPSLGVSNKAVNKMQKQRWMTELFLSAHWGPVSVGKDSSQNFTD